MIARRHLICHRLLLALYGYDYANQDKDYASRGYTNRRFSQRIPSRFPGGGLQRTAVTSQFVRRRGKRENSRKRRMR